MALKAWERYEVRVRNLGADNDHFWAAEIPQLDGCKAYGPTREAAFEALQGVAEAFVEIAEEDGDPLPLPLSEVPQSYSGRFVVRVTSSLHKDLAERAKAEGVSLNHLCYELLAAGIGERRTLRTVNHYHITLKLPDTQASAMPYASGETTDWRNWTWRSRLEPLVANTTSSAFPATGRKALSRAQN
jgi:antitoxin HicB